jgi:hypothetical protein
MKDFPAFMKHSANEIATSSQSTPGVEGYVFDGADGSQMAFWTCRDTAESAAHVHDFDEYMIVVEGCYTLIVGGQRIPVIAGPELDCPDTGHSRQVSGTSDCAPGAVNCFYRMRLPESPGTQVTDFPTHQEFVEKGLRFMGSV